MIVPTIVILALAGVSLAIRKEGPRTLGFKRDPRPWRMASVVLAATAGWSLVQLGLTMPVLNHLTGEKQDLSQFRTCRAISVRWLFSWYSRGR